MEQKIVSVFMFSEPHEQELLWLKFNVENAYVTEWVITESCYTFQGRVKPMYLHEIFAQNRFAKFRNKVHIIQLNHNYNFEYEIGYFPLLKRKIKRWLNANYNGTYVLAPYAELASFHAEIIQRQACVSYLREHYAQDDIVLVCDVDEIFDFNDGKMQHLQSILQTNKTPFYIPRLVFCYDYDNLTRRTRYVPIIHLKDLQHSTVQQIKHPSWQHRQIVDCESILVYEYTFCFSKEAIVSKLATFAHVSELNRHAIEFCLANNIAFINPTHITTRYLQDQESFYERITINEKTAPRFLRDHIEDFLTRIVRTDYREQRKLNGIEQQ